MRLTSNLNKLQSMSREDLEQQAMIANYFLINELLAKGEIITAPLRNESFDNVNNNWEVDFESSLLMINELATLRLTKDYNINYKRRDRNYDKFITIAFFD